MAHHRPKPPRRTAAKPDSSAQRQRRGARRQLDDLDVATFTAIARTRSPLVDATMPPLTRAADRSKLWIAIAGLLALSGRPRARRAAARGLAAIGITSLIANQVSKRVHRRPRPSLTQVPVQRLAHRIPTSTSFPSGHSASAVAFAAAASAEVPALTVPLRALAGLVGFSRVATGAHYPTDVAAGFALGEMIAWLTTRVVPVERVNPLQDAPTVHAGTPRPDGEGITLVINPRSGSGRAGRILPDVRRALPRMRIVTLTGDDDYARAIGEAASSCEVLAVAGGDGTVQQAAAAALENGIPLAVLPAGTFNHFAKDLGMFPLSAAIDAIRAGTVAKVDLGEINGKIFVNTASVGAYTDFVAIRERDEHRIGKPLAAVVAAFRTLGQARAVHVRVRDLDGKTVDARFSLLFLGNGRYEPRGFAPVHRATLDDARLDLRVLGVSRRGSRARVVVDLFTGRISRNRLYQQYSDAEFELELLDGPYRIARDGELGEEVDHLSARVLPRALTVIAPSALSRR